VPKTSKRKPKSSVDAVEGKTKRPRVPGRSGQVAGQRGAGECVRGLDPVDAPAVFVQPDQPASAVNALKPGWAENLGKTLAQQDIEVNGKTNKAFVRSPEMRMKMKLAQRARRAREHQGAR
jgi:hypothetical protein